MTSAARRLPDTDDRDAPLNAMLDLVETAIRTALDQGLEAPLRARLARLVPEPAPEPCPACSERAAAPQSPVRDAERGLQLASVLTVVRQIERFKLAGAQHQAIAHLKAWLVEEMGR